MQKNCRDHKGIPVAIILTHPMLGDLRVGSRDASNGSAELLVELLYDAPMCHDQPWWPRSGV